MTIYNVHIYREMRLLFGGIKAGGHEEAAALARAKLTDEADAIDDCEGETYSALVDVQGDEEYDHSRVVDFEPERSRRAAPELLAALTWLLDDLTDAGEDRHPETGREYDSVAFARAARDEANTISMPAVDTLKPRSFIVRSTEEPSDFWSNDSGWGCLDAAARFDAGEIATLNLPIRGSWSLLKPYSVLLLYPDHSNDGGTETHYAFVEAPDAIEAIAVAQRQASAAQPIDIDQPTDFAPLLVTEGHHASQPLFNK